MTDRTQQEIRIRTLHTLGAAFVEESGGHLEVRSIQPLVPESPQLIAQGQILPILTNTGKKFLSERADHRHLKLGNQSPAFPNNALFAIRAAPAQRQRPDGSVDQYFHATLRCFL